MAVSSATTMSVTSSTATSAGADGTVEAVPADRHIQPDAEGDTKDRPGYSGQQLRHDERQAYLIRRGAEGALDCGGVPGVLHRRPRDEDGVDERK